MRAACRHASPPAGNTVAAASILEDKPFEPAMLAADDDADCRLLQKLPPGDDDYYIHGRGGADCRAGGGRLTHHDASFRRPPRQPASHAAHGRCARL